MKWYFLEETNTLRTEKKGKNRREDIFLKNYSNQCEI